MIPISTVGELPCSFRHLGVLLIWLKVVQGPVVFAEDVGWGQFLTFFLSSLLLSSREVNITDILLAEPLNL